MSPKHKSNAGRLIGKTLLSLQESYGCILVQCKGGRSRCELQRKNPYTLARAVGLLFVKQICSQEGFREEKSSSRPMQFLEPHVLHPRMQKADWYIFKAVCSPLEGDRAQEVCSNGR